MGDEYDILGGYIPLFVQHLEDTRVRLGIGPPAEEDRISAEDATEHDTDSEPHALPNWTPAERDAFFRAVSVHSRWRPDLIAACVPTKTEWEVWMYLEALEEGAVALTAQADDEDVEMEGAEGHVDAPASDSRSHSHPGSDMDEDEEDVCEPALEVSQDWIDAEECMAAWIIDGERPVVVESEVAADTGDADKKDNPPKRKRGRPRKVVGNPVLDAASPPPARRSPSPEPPSARDCSIAPDAEREALMGRLEVPHLLVLDGFLREDEGTAKGRSRSREGSVMAIALTEHGGDGVPRARDADVSSLSDRITGSGTGNVPESPSDVVIDPVLLALSGHAALAPTERQRGQSNATSYPPARAQPSFRNVPSQESPQPSTGDIFVFPKEDARPANPDPRTNAEPELSLFSPRSRRRIQKRLYMRRKRASQRGESVGPEGTLDAGVKKLRPGKKTKLNRNDASVASISVPHSEAPSDAETELPENMPKKNKPGLTLPYKLKAEFAELGIDAAYLRDQGMDLLNLGKLGKLAGLYASLEHGEEEEPAISESIDGQLIRHLQAAVVSFVTDVMHRAIVWREREIRLKQRSRVWRHGDQFTISAVEHAVAAVGARYNSHKAYFKSLEAFHGLSNGTSSTPGNATEEPSTRDGPVDPDVETADPSTELPELSPYRDAYTPLVCPPPAWRTSPLACLARTYEREATRTRRGTSAELDEDELMSDETDEEALEAELAEEEARDARDMAVSATHEETLWEGCGINK